MQTYLSPAPRPPVSSSWWGDLGVFLLWALAATVWCVSVLGALTIGIFVLPFAAALGIAAVLLTTRRGGRPRCILGAVAGPAPPALWIGSWVARDTLSGAFYPSVFAPFAGTALVLIVLSAGGFAVLERRAHRTAVTDVPWQPQ